MAMDLKNKAKKIAKRLDEICRGSGVKRDYGVHVVTAKVLGRSKWSKPANDNGKDYGKN
jgi:hypothetical protein